MFSRTLAFGVFIRFPFSIQFLFFFFCCSFVVSWRCLLLVCLTVDIQLKPKRPCKMEHEVLCGDEMSGRNGIEIRPNTQWQDAPHRPGVWGRYKCLALREGLRNHVWRSAFHWDFNSDVATVAAAAAAAAGSSSGKDWYESMRIALAVCPRALVCVELSLCGANEWLCASMHHWSRQKRSWNVLAIYISFLLASLKRNYVRTYRQKCQRQRLKALRHLKWGGWSGRSWMSGWDWVWV